MMLQISTTTTYLLRRLWADRKGQDLIEYALLGALGFLAVSVILPEQFVPIVSNLFSKINSSVYNSGNR